MLRSRHKDSSVVTVTAAAARIEEKDAAGNVAGEDPLPVAQPGELRDAQGRLPQKQRGDISPRVSKFYSAISLAQQKKAVVLLGSGPGVKGAQLGEFVVSLLLPVLDHAPSLDVHAQHVSCTPCEEASGSPHAPLHLGRFHFPSESEGHGGPFLRPQRRQCFRPFLQTFDDEGSRGGEGSGGIRVEKTGARDRVLGRADLHVFDDARETVR
jgi:hypothetical protein